MGLADKDQQDLYENHWVQIERTLGAEHTPEPTDTVREVGIRMSTTKILKDPGPLQTERLSNGKRVLLRPLKVKLEDGTIYTVPEGFVTDFSSVPALARPLICWSKVDIAGVVHDYLYWCRHADVTRRHADAVWRELAGAGTHSLSTPTKWLAWGGLFLGGWWSHRKARQASPEQTAARGCSTADAD